MKEHPRISIITIVYNNVAKIEKTILSVVEQSYDNIEYIVIDGASSDGTTDVIRNYSSDIDVFISEPDRGIYDALNKGIKLASGDWIGILNSGDLFCSKRLIEEMFGAGEPDADIVYGNSFSVDANGNLGYWHSTAPVSSMWKGPVYRHGASFVRAKVHKQYLFDDASGLGFAADFENIYKLYAHGLKFEYKDIDVIFYEQEGASFKLRSNIRYNFRIVRKYEGLKPRILFHFFGQYCRAFILDNKFVKGFIGFFYYFLTHFLPNYGINYIPFYCVRHFYYRYIIRLHLGKGSSIHMNTFIYDGKRITIGNNCTINRQCILDARGGIKIGDSVSISPRVCLITADHDIQSSNFSGRTKKIVIDDWVFIGINATILPGVHIGRGAVVSAGAVVTRNVEEFSIVGGIPAKKIGERNRNLDYSCKWLPLFD